MIVNQFKIIIIVTAEINVLVHTILKLIQICVWKSNGVNKFVRRTSKTICQGKQEFNTMF